MSKALDKYLGISNCERESCAVGADAAELRVVHAKGVGKWWRATG